MGLLAAGCAHQGETLVVVVPAADGHVGGVVVRSGGEEKLLDSAYAAARTWQGSGVQAQTVSAQQVDTTFAAARAAQPLPPISFTLYFREGRDEFSAESKAVVDQVFAEIAKRSAVEITVIGHTDRVGYKADNDLLSRQRAERVRADLVDLGIDPAIIHTAGRGEREPLLATPDEVEAPRNRRVEISVR